MCHIYDAYAYIVLDHIRIWTIWTDMDNLDKYLRLRYRMTTAMVCATCDEWNEWNEKCNAGWKFSEDPGRNTQHIYETVLAYHQHTKSCVLYKPRKTYAFTLTTNGDDQALEEEKLCMAAEKLFRQESVPVAKGEAYLEYTEAGRPHIHGWYETVDGGRIFLKIFKRCWPLWGEKPGRTQFAGGYHEVMKTNRYIGYANSEGRLVAKKQ